MKIGEQVPEFSAKAYENGIEKEVNFSDYSGRWVVLFFYPLDFTFVCPTEIRSFAKHEDEFRDLDAVVIGASTDSFFSHKAWFERDLPEVKFPVIADTTHRVSNLFGVLKDSEGVAYRATFIMDPEGIVRFSSVSDLSVGRSVDEVLRVLKALQSGELCPVEWKPGQKTLGRA